MSASISIPNYPASNRVPGVYAVVDPSKANTGQVNQRALLIGQKLASGTAAVNMPLISAGIGEAQASYGLGSMLAIMVARYRAIDPFGELWCLPLADDPASVAATWSLVFTGPATAAGVFPLYVCGNFVPFTVSVGDTATVMGANAATAIAAFADASGNPLPVTAGAATGTVTFTARNKGAVDLDIRVAYGGTLNGELVPSGVGYTITNLNTGATNPTTLAAALANLTDRTYDFIGTCYNDTGSLNALGAFLNDVSGRWSWLSELFGHVFCAKRGTFAALGTFGTARNDQHASVMGFYDSPSIEMHWAADLVAACAVSLRADPAVPLGGLGGGVQLNVLAPPEPSRFDISERNTLLYDGVSTFVTNDAGQVFVNMLITTYQLNAAGAPDNSYLGAETMFQLMDVIRTYRTFIQSNFNQKTLVADGSRIPPGSSLVTAQVILLAIIGVYRQQALAGKVQNPSVFAQQAQAQNAGNGLVKLLLPVQLANQLRIVAMNIQFTKP